MSKWIALCNGGPNDTTVGAECTSLGKAIGTLESMMIALHATIGQVQRADGQTTLDQGYFVKSEKDAGRCDDEI
jgi:hypothetical protein